MMRSGCISVLIVTVIILVSSAALLYAAPDNKQLTVELIDAAHRVLDLGYDCAKSGAERAACHAQLTTAIKNRVR